mmetsp:Transcript_17901/g.36493  ORF Transcript_17901/g.36493 Transcript_17901/m.36493 type:complete len:188 (-) Transcript_17901:1630-2193(-)
MLPSAIRRHSSKLAHQASITLPRSFSLSASCSPDVLFKSVIATRSFSTNPKKGGSEFIFSRLVDESKVTPLIAKLQQECWDGYVATGRGCHTLFQLVDTNSSGSITFAELRFFLENVRESDINPEAKKQLLSAAHDHMITFPEFQAWLIRATKVDPGLKNTFAAEHYHASIGSSHAETEHSWNKHTM